MNLLGVSLAGCDPFGFITEANLGTGAARPGNLRHETPRPHVTGCIDVVE